MSCPTPFKVRFPNALEACNALIAAKKRMVRNGETKGPIRFYECRCGGWHFTSHPLEDPEHQTGVLYVR